MSVPRTLQDINENFLLRRLKNSGYVTSFYEDAQDVFPPLEQLWVPYKQSAADYPPATYYTKTFMKSRAKLIKIKGPVFCMHGQSTNQVIIIVYLKFFKIMFKNRQFNSLWNRILFYLSMLKIT